MLLFWHNDLYRVVCVPEVIDIKLVLEEYLPLEFNTNGVRVVDEKERLDLLRALEVTLAFDHMCVP